MLQQWQQINKKIRVAMLDQSSGPSRLASCFYSGQTPPIQKCPHCSSEHGGFIESSWLTAIDGPVLCINPSYIPLN